MSSTRARTGTIPDRGCTAPWLSFPLWNANRLESVATRRSSSPSTSMRTPVRNGRDSSAAAANAVCRIMRRRAPWGIRHISSSSTSGSAGNSSSGMVCTEKRERPEASSATPFSAVR